MAIETWKIDELVSQTQTQHESNETRFQGIPHSLDATLGDQQLGAQVFTLRGGKSDGLRILRLVCGATEVDLCLNRGMGITDIQRSGTRFGWDSPLGQPVHPMWVDMGEPSGLGWLDGFTETVVRCGLASNGAPEHDEQGVLQYPLHGRIANLPAENVRVDLDSDSGTISVTADVFETRFHFHKLRLTTTVTLRTDSNEVEISDTVSNLYGSPAEIQMLYHNNFGAPILHEGARFLAPVAKLVPRNDLSLIHI